MNIYPVIIAGGSGTRFWPASRFSRPKQFLRIMGTTTMVEQTVERLRPLCPEENIIIVSNEAHHSLLHDLFQGKPFVSLEEPLGRNTAPAIGLAAIYLIQKGISDSPMVVLPADHYIGDVAQFRDRLLTGCTLAREERAIITIGLVPTRPETGYGYLQRGSLRAERDGTKIYGVRRFVEKPNEDDALRYVASGEYLWNGGIFMFTPQLIIEEISLHLPDLYEGLVKIGSSLGQSDFPEALRSAYHAFPSISIDYGVMEKTRRTILTIPGDFGWSDVGSWDSVYHLQEREWDEQRNLLQGENLVVGTQSSLLFNQSARIVVALGLKDVVIVSTDDVILVADMKRSQDIKLAIEEIKKQGLHTVL